MKNIFFTILSFLFAISVNAQLINDGASIIVEDGATLFIEGSLQNNTTGSIDICGDAPCAPTPKTFISTLSVLAIENPSRTPICPEGIVGLQCNPNP